MNVQQGVDTMLILSRRPNESVHIGRDVKVTVLGIRGNQVRIGITAPKNVTVDREEVHARKQREHTLSVTAVPAVPSIRSAASESRAFDSPSSLDPVPNPVAGFGTEPVHG
jgi:carbon storage regulator